jgi:hypothetical protein
MATTISLTHEFPSVPLAVFEKHLNDPRLNEMLKAMPSFRSREMVSHEVLPKGDQHWKFRVVAGGALPASVAKIIPEDMLSWWEETRFFSTQHCLRFQITPMKASPFSSFGTWHFFEADGGTKRVIEATIDVKIPFVGKVIENFFASEIRKNFEIEPEILCAFFETIQKEKNKRKKAM